MSSQSDLQNWLLKANPDNLSCTFTGAWVRVQIMTFGAEKAFGNTFYNTQYIGIVPDTFLFFYILSFIVSLIYIVIQISVITSLLE